MENFDGGLPQNFLMELLEIPNMESKFNVSVNGRPPLFYLHGIESSASYKVKLFAVNAKGLSDPVFLETSSFKGAAKYTSKNDKFFHELSFLFSPTPSRTLCSNVCSRR